jgi:hypothetical protein
MSSRGAAVLEHAKAIGLRHKLNMLPVLKKPFETDALVKILRELKLGLPPAVATRLDLQEALNNNWIEFWYQPKIHLRKKRLAGAEAFVRARHPQHGVVLPGAFLPGAPDASVLKLSEFALVCALKAGENFAKLGAHLTISVNIPLACLLGLPLEDLIKTHRPQNDKCRRKRSSPTSPAPAKRPKSSRRSSSSLPSTALAAGNRPSRKLANCPSPKSNSQAPS